MCLAIPVKIVHITGHSAEVELNGTRTIVDVTLVPEAQVNDYVIIHAGMAIQWYDEEDAQKTLALLKEFAKGIEAAP